MLINTSDLEKEALDWAVAMTKPEVFNKSDFYYRVRERLGVQVYFKNDGVRFNPSGNWSQGGPIIEREGIEVNPMHDESSTLSNRTWSRGWFAGRSVNDMRINSHEASGSTFLEAGLRCYVASKLGNKVEIPDELVENLKKRNLKP